MVKHGRQNQTHSWSFCPAPDPYSNPLTMVPLLKNDQRESNDSKRYDMQILKKQFLSWFNHKKHIPPQVLPIRIFGIKPFLVCFLEMNNIDVCLVNSLHISLTWIYTHGSGSINSCHCDPNKKCNNSANFMLTDSQQLEILIWQLQVFQ